MTVPGFAQFGSDLQGSGKILEGCGRVVKLEENAASVGINDFIHFLFIFWIEFESFITALEGSLVLVQVVSGKAPVARSQGDPGNERRVSYQRVLTTPS